MMAQLVSKILKRKYNTRAHISLVLNVSHKYKTGE
jgi:hypothetical protein